MYIDTSGNVGINELTPRTKLEVKVDTSSRNTVTRVLTLNANGAGIQPYEPFGTGIIFEGFDYAGGGGTSTSRDYAYIDARMETSGSTPVDFSSRLVFATNSGGSSTATPDNKMIISGQGNVGIGISDIANKFMVKGGISSHSVNNYVDSVATIISPEYSDNNYHSLLQLVSVRQSLTTGNGANGYIGFSTIDDSNDQGQKDAGRIAIVNESGSSRNSATALSFWTNPGGTQDTSASEKLRITSAGVVQVGATTGYTTIQQGGFFSKGGGNIYTANLLAGAANTKIFQIQRNDVEKYNIGLGSDDSLAFINSSGSKKISITTDGELKVGTSTGAAARVHIVSTSKDRKQMIEGNGNNQGTAEKITIVNHYPVVSSGSQLIIPFVSQGNLNSTTIMKVMGHSAKFNSSDPLGFTATIQVGHLQQLYSVSALDTTGNITGVSTSGMNLIISFNTAYTSSTADGVFVTIEFMSNTISYSIDVANIAMN